MIIAIDFDGTCVTQAFPDVGETLPGAVRVLRQLVAEGHQLILWTVRNNSEGEVITGDPSNLKIGGNYLDAAVQWFVDNDIELWGANENPNQSTWSKSPKVYVDLYIDDRALGAPLYKFPGVISCIDWGRVEEILVRDGILKDFT